MRYFCAMVILLVAGPVFASVQIPGLFNTGVDSGGSLLTNPAVDPHYSITSTTATAYTPDDAYAYDSLQDVINVYGDVWVHNTATSEWIGPSSDLSEPFDPDWAGFYNYDLTFDLTGLDPSTAAISGVWSSDNGSQIWLNGVYAGISKGNSGYSSLDPFSLTSGFQPGINTLTFVVNNANESLAYNPSGLHVNNLQGTANAIPEAAAIYVWSGLALAAVGCRGKGVRNQIQKWISIPD